jgi:hypothetical protein
MPLPTFVRDGIIKLARQDILDFLDEHEDQLVAYFREEMQGVDDRLDEEKLFIDIRMGPLGEVLIRAVLRAIRRFVVNFGEEEAGRRAGASDPQDDPDHDPDRG